MKYLLIGCGKMGSALYKNISKHTKVIELNDSLKNLTVIPNTILLAVKPQHLTNATQGLKEKLNKNHTIISIVAGVTVKQLSTLLGTTNIVRAMPNTPAMIGEGITTIFAHQKNRGITKNLFSPLGKIIWVEKEAHLEVATAISGSGPAYVFYFIKAWKEAAKKLGLTSSIADELIWQTIRGSLTLSKNKDLDQLIGQVKSKGGTTEKALFHLEEHAVSQNITQAIIQAHTKALEISKLYEV